MIRRHASVFRAMLVAADVALALAVAGLAIHLRFGPQNNIVESINAGLPDPWLAAAVFVALWVATLWLHGLYRSRANWTIRTEFLSVIRATLVFAVTILSLLFWFKLANVSRMLLVIVLPSLGAAAFGVRVAIRMLLSRLRARGINVRYMLVVGANARAEAFAQLVEGHTELGLVVIGHIKATDHDNGVFLRHPILGTMDDLETILHTRIVDEVAICLPFALEEMIEQTALLCEQEGKVVRIPVAPVERVLSLGHLENIDGTGVYSRANGPDRTLGLITKRAIDVVAAGLGLVLLSPALALVALVVRLDSPGPALFRQERVGLHGRSFRVVKFRTMCANAEELLDELRPENQIRGHAFKLDRDPRVTRIGGFLRCTSLDELPQLWNVLKGEMSLVGPRPPLPREVAQYDIWHRRRLSMKPGITGLWQVRARREQEFDHWVEQDLEYIDGWSLWLDLKILALTVPAMLTGSGR
jgi:exopolysaccharide biosynthesis polyprenyl glycosylphosphotransferase